MSLPAEIFEGGSGRDKQAGEKRNEDDADDCDTRSGHELCYFQIVERISALGRGRVALGLPRSGC